MANNTAKTVASLFIGAAVGVAVGYILATDKETRNEAMKEIKNRLTSTKEKLAKKGRELVEEKYSFDTPRGGGSFGG